MTKRVRLSLDLEPATAPSTRQMPNVSKFDPKFVATARFLASRGAIQSDLADCFGVTTRTIQNWIVQHAEFAEAVAAGNDVFNVRVERALAERAIGFYADQYTWRELSDEERARRDDGERFELIPTDRKYFPPDVTAQIFFTKNRMSDKWRDVQEHKVSGAVKSPDEWLADIRSDIRALQTAGYLKTIDVKALPAPKGKNGKGHD